MKFIINILAEGLVKALIVGAVITVALWSPCPYSLPEVQMKPNSDKSTGKPTPLKRLVARTIVSAYIVASAWVENQWGWLYKRFTDDKKEPHAPKE